MGHGQGFWALDLSNDFAHPVIPLLPIARVGIPLTLIARDRACHGAGVSPFAMEYWACIAAAQMLPLDQLALTSTNAWT